MADAEGLERASLESEGANNEARGPPSPWEYGVCRRGKKSGFEIRPQAAEEAPASYPSSVRGDKYSYYTGDYVSQTGGDSVKLAQTFSKKSMCDAHVVANGAKVGILSLALCSGFAAAQEIRPAYESSLLQVLIRKGIISEQEAGEIIEEARKKEQASEAVASQALDKKELDKKELDKKELVKSVTEDVTKNITKLLPRISGKFQPQYAYRPGGDGVEGTNAFGMRRARLSFRGGKGDFSYNLGFRADDDATNVDLLEAEVIYTGLVDSVGEFHVGKTLPPIYFHSSSALMLAQRELADSLLWRGTTGRITGAVLFKGTDLTRSSGFLGDRLQFGLGVYNGAEQKNRDNKLMYSGLVAITPRGKMSGNEINSSFSGFRYQVGVSYSGANDVPGDELTTRGSRQSPAPELTAQRFDERFFGAFLEGEGRGWVGKARYKEIKSDYRSGPAPFNSLGEIDEKLVTRVWSVGGSRAFRLAGDKAWALAALYEKVKNERPSLSRAMTLGQANQSSLLAFDEGDVWHLAASYILSKDIKFTLEYARSDGERRGAELPGGTTEPQNMLLGLLDYRF